MMIISFIGQMNVELLVIPYIAHFAKGFDNLYDHERNFCYASNLWVHLQFRLLTMVNWGIYVTECPLEANPSPPILVIGPLIYAPAPGNHPNIMH